MLLKILRDLITIILLTILTQIGGIVYLLSLLFFRKATTKKRLKRIGVFTLLYIITTFAIIPYVAPIFGREPIKESKYVKAHSFVYKLTNRNYVRPELNTAIQKIANSLHKKHKGIQLVYLDANFPFIDGFPLLPHLSHNDGKKIDITLLYKDAKDLLTNKKKSVSGYGVYAGPTKKRIQSNCYL